MKTFKSVQEVNEEIDFLEGLRAKDILQDIFKGRLEALLAVRPLLMRLEK
jgi:hypothetical protein